jgi:transposase
MTMARILGIDLGKFELVSCLLNTETDETDFWTLETSWHYVLTVLRHYKPDRVVVESCSITRRIHAVCTVESHQILVCSPNEEA